MDSPNSTRRLNMLEPGLAKLETVDERRRQHCLTSHGQRPFIPFIPERHRANWLGLGLDHGTTELFLAPLCQVDDCWEKNCRESREKTSLQAHVYVYVYIMYD